MLFSILLPFRMLTQTHRQAFAIKLKQKRALGQITAAAAAMKASVRTAYWK